MSQKIINTAIKKFQRLSKRYSGFINIGVDDWRGWRFVFDTIDVRNCQNNCPKCQLYQLLKNEKEKFFSAGLYEASEEDKKIFGPKNFLNCKTLKQYEDCFVNFIVKKTKTENAIKKELTLVKNLRIIFSQGNRDLRDVERKFRQNVIAKILRQTSASQKCTIKKIITQIGFDAEVN